MAPSSWSRGYWTVERVGGIIVLERQHSAEMSVNMVKERIA
jgi:hypothetical protein